MFNTSLFKLNGEYVYFILPLKESAKYHTGSKVRFQVYIDERCLGSFDKTLGIGRMYGKEKKLYHIILPLHFVQKTKLKIGSEVNIKSNERGINKNKD